MKIQPIKNKISGSSHVATIVDAHKSRSDAQVDFGETSKEMQERAHRMKARADQIFDSLEKNIKILTWLTSAALVGISILLVMVFLV